MIFPIGHDDCKIGMSIYNMWNDAAMTAVFLSDSPRAKPEMPLPDNPDNCQSVS
jgi:hypothetical protein